MMGPAVTLVSSNLASCQYDPEAQILRVTFSNGGSYFYQGVDQATYDGLISAPSHGKFFHANIRTRFRASRDD